MNVVLTEALDATFQVRATSLDVAYLCRVALALEVADLLDKALRAAGLATP